MTRLPRYTIRAAGESGQGINSVGEIISKALKNSGYHTFGYREYPSLIQGGHAFQQIEIADHEVHAPSRGCDLLICLSRPAFHAYVRDVHPQGRILHSIGRLDILPDDQKWLDENGVTVEYLDAESLALAAGGKRIMSNTVLLGRLWKMLCLAPEALHEVLKETFAKKPEVVTINALCLTKGYEAVPDLRDCLGIRADRTRASQQSMLLSGNHLLALGALAAGARAYYAYPMTPSSSILTYLAEVQHETGMVVKQVDDEIAAAQMALGSMFMGTRALTGTSGGGFDLMTEGVSLAGMTETPFVCILAQRPGPATGLPTWTSAADLLLAVHAGHGEFARAVIAVSDPGSCYVLMQKAFNWAEKYQMPVIVMTDKEIAESLFQMEKLPANIPMERGLVPEAQLDSLKPEHRYSLTDSGVSPRWLPGQADATYDANSDEHLPDGTLTEEAAPSKAMYDKRLRKLTTLLTEVEEPVLYGPATATTTFVGWGSVKNSVLDALAAQGEQANANYLHFETVWPLKTEKFLELTKSNSRLVLIEQNGTGQLGQLLASQTGYLFQNKLLKYDGRPFFVDEIIEYLEQK